MQSGRVSARRRSNPSRHSHIRPKEDWHRRQTDTTIASSHGPLPAVSRKAKPLQLCICSPRSHASILWTCGHDTQGPVSGRGDGIDAACPADVAAPWQGPAMGRKRARSQVLNCGASAAPAAPSLCRCSWATAHSVPLTLTTLATGHCSERRAHAHAALRTPHRAHAAV
jgi:hypothetical protein